MLWRTDFRWEKLSWVGIECKGRSLQVIGTQEHLCVSASVGLKVGLNLNPPNSEGHNETDQQNISSCPPMIMQSVSPELLALINTWPKLPEPVTAVILELVKQAMPKTS